MAFIASFRERGIFPPGVQNLSVDTLTWQRPDVALDALAAIKAAKAVRWRRDSDRDEVFRNWNQAAARLYIDVLDKPETPDAFFAALGLVRASAPGQPLRQVTIDGKKGKVSRIEIGSVRPAWRVAPNGDILSDVIVEMTQRWKPDDGGGKSFRGGCTIICDLDSGDVRYVIRKRVGNSNRTNEEVGFRGALAEAGDHSADYFDDTKAGGELFAMMHRGL